jgi:hypothetical protein
LDEATTALLVRAKLAGVVALVAVAVTLYGPPAVELAVQVIEALPLKSVVAVVAEGVQLAPVAGTAKVTVTPLTPVPFEVTFATSGFVNAAPTNALCPPPLAAVIAIVGAGFELELLQPVNKPKARQTTATKIDV